LYLFLYDKKFPIPKICNQNTTLLYKIYEIYLRIPDKDLILYYNRFQKFSPND